jgi:hypothetical protein
VKFEFTHNISFLGDVFVQLYRHTTDAGGTLTHKAIITDGG